MGNRNLDIDARVKPKSHGRIPVVIYKDFLMIDSQILSYIDKFVFVMLKAYESKTSDPYPSIRTLAKVIGMSTKTAQKSLKRLEELGFVVIERRTKGKTKAKTSNLYHLHDNQRMCAGKTEEEIKELAKMTEEEVWAKRFLEMGWTPPEEAETKKRASTAATIESSEKDTSLYDKNTTEDDESQEFSQDFIEEMISFDALTHDFPQDAGVIEDIVKILYDTLNRQQNTIRVGGENKKVTVVRSRLLSLNYDMIVSVLSKFKEQSASTKIKYVKSYLLSMLYTEPTQYSSSVEASYRYNS